MPRFSELLLDHARHPRNFGRDVRANVVGRADFNGQPPVVEVYLRIEEGHICHASFEATGCGVTIAACSALTEILNRDRTIDYSTLSSERLAEALEGIPRDKLFCAEVALAAVRNGMQGHNYEAR